MLLITNSVHVTMRTQALQTKDPSATPDIISQSMATHAEPEQTAHAPCSQWLLQ
jgi:hypothetical protein